MKRSLQIFFFLAATPLLAGVDSPITYCDPLECLMPDYCTTPCSESECEFLEQISCESRRLYNSLDCEGKNRAIEIAHCYCDKDCAVEQAAREMCLRQKGQYPNLEDYEERVEGQAGQNAYNRRFGY